jgi:hypothetical protein
MRAIMAFRKKEMCIMRASKLGEVPKSTLKVKVNNKEQNIEKLFNFRSCTKLV